MFDELAEMASDEASILRSVERIRNHPNINEIYEDNLPSSHEDLDCLVRGMAQLRFLLAQAVKNLRKTDAELQSFKIETKKLIDALKK